MVLVWNRDVDDGARRRGAIVATGEVVDWKERRLVSGLNIVVVWYLFELNGCC